MSETREDGASPRELFTGRAVSAELDFRVGSGDFCQCTVPNTDNSMSGRTEDCISVLPTGNRSGSVKMMSIDTGRIVTRDLFRVLPMPPHVVSRLNDLASREGRTKNNAEGVQRYEAASRGENTLPSFEEVLGGESEDPILSMNLSPPDYAQTVQPEVESEPTPATLGDANKGNEYHNPEERENTGEREETGGGEESVVAEQVIAQARRTMMDTFRRGDCR